MQIVKHDHQRMFAREAREQGCECVKQPEPQLLRVVFGFDRCATAATAISCQPRDLRSRCTQHRGEPLWSKPPLVNARTTWVIGQ